MRRLCALVLLVVVGIGCAPAVPLESQLLTPPKEWTATYGDSERSRIYYNLAVVRVVLNQHARVINSMATTQPAVEPTTQPTLK